MANIKHILKCYLIIVSVYQFRYCIVGHLERQPDLVSLTLLSK